MEKLVTEILKKLGEDPNREGLLKTPERVKKSLTYLTQGYTQNPFETLQEATYAESTDSMIVVKDIELYSLCEHHLLPFVGKCHVGYLPKDRVVGLSKIPRVVEIFSRRLQMQERLTEQVANAIYEVLTPKGVGVIIEAAHLCLQMRGIQKQHSRMITSCMLGTFRDDAKTREEFMSFVK